MTPRRAHAVRLVLTALVAVAAVRPVTAQTQGDGARVYWKTLAGANAVTFWPVLATGNANPFDPSHTVSPSAHVDATLAMLGVHKVLPLHGRSSTLSLFLPVGNLNGQVTGLPTTPTESSRGFGDPMAQLTVNLAGAPAIRTLAQAARYEPKFTVDLLGALAVPVGEYTDAQGLNLGQNRWYGRIGMPVMVALAPWVPGQRTTLEVLPAVWFFGENDDRHGGTLTNDPLFQLEGHVTRDFTETFWGSFDASWFAGATPTTDGVAGDALNNSGVGFTLGFQVTPNLAINTSYFSTIGDGAATDLEADEFRVMFTYGWHALLEGVKRIGKE